MPAPTDFAKLVPGFDFLQGLMKNAGAAVPSMGQWIAPTLDPEEIEKRIEQLRTVQFWLEQNARMLSATIQALEVQRMTLSTLKTMNLPMDAVRESFKLRTPEPEGEPKASAVRKKAAPASAAAIPGPVDPMQWWGALTQQFTELAKNALKDTATDAAKNLATQAIKSAVEMPGKMAAKAVSAGLAAGKSAARSAGNRAGNRAGISAGKGTRNITRKR